MDLQGSIIFILKTYLRDRDKIQKLYRRCKPDDSRKATRNLPKELADGAKTHTQKHEVNYQNLDH